jgi:uncharacterized protein YbjQ (UPF0145 family)/uncharacterized Zn finger protein (UPF0148 family)
MEKCEDCSNIQTAGLVICSKCSSGFLVSIDEVEVQQSIEEQEIRAAKDEAQIKTEEAAALAQQEAWGQKSAAMDKWKTEISENSARRIKAYGKLAPDTIEVLTLPVHPSRKVLKTLGLVKGVSDIQAGLFSLTTQQTIYESGFEIAKRELMVSALALGANAVIGVFPLVNSNNPGSSTLAGGGMKSTETVILCGTAVVLE